jgi:hypothetical protein
MVRHCEVCGTAETQCDAVEVHFARTGAGRRLVEEMLYGKWEEETREDEKKGREASKRMCVSAMEAGPERDAARAKGAAYAVKQAEAREAKILGKRCDICWVPRKECEWPEVHFSQKEEWVAHCNEVLWVMMEAQDAADEKAGRKRKKWKIGDRPAEGEGKERAVEEGLKWAEVHAAAYEAQVLALC